MAGAVQTNAQGDQLLDVASRLTRVERAGSLPGRTASTDSSGGARVRDCAGV